MKKYLYVFTRKDLTASQIAVQSIHSAFEMGREYSSHLKHPSVVLIRMKNEKDLLNAEQYLKGQGLDYRAFIEPFYNHSLTSLSVSPVSNENRHLFKKFQLMKDTDFIEIGDSNE